MTPEEYRRVEEVLLSALSVAEADRAAWLDERAPSGTVLRAEVDSLLAHHRDDDFLEDPPALPAADDPAEPTGQPRAIGEFDVIEVLGMGGMGVVYRAVERDLNREVALKLVRGSCASPRTLARFRREARLLGRLRHPGIAQVYAAGVASTEEGERPYLSMELIEGAPLLEHVERRGLDRRGRLELVVQIARAIQHAHERGVIHRDLKPANVLVDHGGRARVVDFGVARAVDPEATRTTLQTEPERLVGTLLYMSPEQARADRGELDARSDVYALGVLGYELLTGRHPYELGAGGVGQLLQRIGRGEARPMTSIDPSLRGELDILIGKAMALEPARRYPSAQAFAQDVERYLCDEPIRATPPSAVYRVQKFAARNRALVAGLSAVIVTLVLAVAALWRENEKTRAQAQRAEAANTFLATFLTDWISIEDNAFLDRRRVLDRASERASAVFADDPAAEREVIDLLHLCYSILGDQHASAKLVERRAELLREEGASASVLERFELATALVAELRYDEAIEVMRDTLAEVEGDEGYEPGRYPAPEVLRAGIGASLCSLGRVDEGLGDLLELRADLDRLEHELDPLSYRMVLLQLKMGFDQAGLVDEAAESMELVLAELERVRGPRHPTTVRHKIVLAELQRRRGAHAEALRIYEEAIPALKAYAGPDSHDVSVARLERAQCRIAMGRGAEAIDDLLELRATPLDGPHIGWPLRGQIAIALADAYRAVGDGERVTAFFAEAVSACSAVAGPRAEATLDARERLARWLYASEGDPSQLDELLEIADMAEEELGADSWMAFDLRYSAAHSLWQAGFEAEAEPHLLSTFERLIRDPVVNEEALRWTSDALLFRYEDTGRVAEAEALRRSLEGKLP